MTDFQGRMCELIGGATFRVLGRYEWIDRITPEPRIKGVILADRRGHSGKTDDPTLPPGFGCPFGWFGQRQFMGRAVQLTIPGVGISPVRLRSPGFWDDVRFEAYAPPIVEATPEQIAETLWTPMYDALQGAGYPDLAEMARAACVLIQGFQPDPAKKRKEVAHVQA